MSEIQIFTGMALRDALTAARRLGCDVEVVRRTGEIRVSHPSLVRSIKVNLRRKSASRALTAFLRRVERVRDTLVAVHG